MRETSSTRTQHNESINASIRIRAPKNKMFASSNEARVQMAIGKKNDPFSESKLIQSICTRLIAPNVMKEIKKDESKQHQRNIQKQSQTEKKKKILERMKSRQRSQEQLGDYKS